MWSRLLSAAIGIWLIAAPGVLHYAPGAQTNDRIVGPLVVSFSIIAIWQITRALRWLNLPLGLWLIVAPGLLDHVSKVARWSDLAAGIVLVALAFVRGPCPHRFAGGWPSLWQKNSTR